MGVSVSASTLIIMAAVLLSATVAYNTMNNSVQTIQTAHQHELQHHVKTQNTAIMIQNASYNTSTNTVTIQIKNTGATTLSSKATDVLLNGRYQTGYTETVDGSSTRDVWVPGTQMRVTLTNVTSKPSRVKVVTQNEIAAETGVN